MYDVNVTQFPANTESLINEEDRIKMHRTQIMLEEEQYQAVCERARKQNKSMGAIIRELLDRALAATKPRKRRPFKLSDGKGLFSDNETRGRDHDAYLYGGS